jgi:hypothetical protein
MATVLENVLTPELLQSIILLPEVVAAKERLASSGKVSFSIPLSAELRLVLQTRFGLTLPSNVSDLPMRWIKGDTVPHVDSGASKFANTYLVYLNSTPGSFLIGDMEYPITANTGYKFSEGLSHKTQGTGNEPRLLLGPMNEFAEPVGGGSVILYYSNYASAFAMDSTSIASNFANNTYVLGDIDSGSIGSYTSWRVATVIPPNNSVTGVYPNGSTLPSAGDPVYYLYPVIPCFLEGSKILCSIDNIDTYIPIETIRPGTLVKTSKDGYKKVELIGKGFINNPDNDERNENRLYKCSVSKYPELTEDLYITGCHSILVDTLSESQKERIKRNSGRLFITDNKYRLTACVDERSEPWNLAGIYTIWHIALENPDIRMNYGIYANGGLLVETTSLNFLKKYSNLTIF